MDDEIEHRDIEMVALGFIQQITRMIVETGPVFAHGGCEQVEDERFVMGNHATAWRANRKRFRPHRTNRMGDEHEFAHRGGIAQLFDQLGSGAGGVAAQMRNEPEAAQHLAAERFQVARPGQGGPAKG